LTEINFKINSTPSNKEYKDTFHENGLYLAPDKMRIMIDERLETADAKTRLDLVHILNLLVLHCDLLYTAKFEHRLIDVQRYSLSLEPVPYVLGDKLNETRRSLAEAEATFRLALNQFDLFKSGVDEKIVTYRARLPIIRKRIEASLGRI
jgi:hypothetical protein